LDRAQHIGSATQPTDSKAPDGPKTMSAGAFTAGATALGAGLLIGSGLIFGYVHEPSRLLVNAGGVMGMASVAVLGVAALGAASMMMNN